MSTPKCVTCGYDLRSHRGAAQCPECGTPVRKTLRAAARNIYTFDRWIWRLPFLLAGLHGAVVISLGVVCVALGGGEMWVFLEIAESVDYPADWLVSSVVGYNPKTGWADVFYLLVIGSVQWWLVGAVIAWPLSPRLPKG